MANAVKQVGETGLELTMEFPDTKTRADFEVAFRGWSKQYQQAASTRQLVGALVAKEVATDADDTDGHLMKVYDYSDGSWWYLDFV